MSRGLSKEGVQGGPLGAGQQQGERSHRGCRGAVKQFAPGREDKFAGLDRRGPREKSNKLPLFVCIACCCLCVGCCAYLYNAFKKAFA